MDMPNLNITCGDFDALKKIVELVGLPGRWAQIKKTTRARTAKRGGPLGSVRRPPLVPMPTAVAKARIAPSAEMCVLSGTGG
jgi:hypothetical protein